MGNLYATVSELKTILRLTDTKEDAALLLRLEEASRWIDNETKRFFYVWSGTRYCNPVQMREILLPADLLSVTSIKTDEDADGVFETTWLTTDYLLQPNDAWPKTRLYTTVNGARVFPSTYPKSVEITGTWGYGDGVSASPWLDSGATVTLTTAVTTAGTVSDQSLLKVGQTILVGTEQLFIRALTDATTDTITVDRAQNGTTGAIHTGAAASIAQYPAGIYGNCADYALWRYRRASAPFGVAGSSEFGTPTVNRVDLDVLRGIAPYRRAMYF